jgi:transposase
MSDSTTPIPASDKPAQQGTLFDMPPVVPSESPAPSTAKPRLQRAQRDQHLLLPTDLDGLIPEDHRARVVWDYVTELDLGRLYQKIQAVEHRPGRPAIDPMILLALWLYATIEGEGSARALAELCENHNAYRWMCGGVSVNYHTLSDFRTQHPEFLDDLLTHSVATLMEQDLVDLHRVAQDGMRVRASAGAASFRRRPTLEECLREAEEQVRRLQAELDADPTQSSRRKQEAGQRAARERSERVRQALAQLPELEAKKKAADKQKARASTTDPEARVMKMGDGGFRPAYNLQYATDTATQVIVGVDVTNSGSDLGQMAPMVEQIQERHGQAPDEMLVDGGFAKKEDIDQVSTPEIGTVVYAPPQKSKDPERDEHTPRADDSPAVAEWRQRMGTAAAKEIYKERAATAECVNALARNRGLQRLLVRGLAKVRTIALWFALAHNLMRTAVLRTTGAVALGGGI